MPPPPLRFAANVGWLFTEGEADIWARCEAAKAAGFDAVEIPDPYGYWGRAGGPEETPRPPLPALPVALINSPRGDVAAGEMGLGALPGREADFLDSLQTAIAHAKALKVHLLSGRLPPGVTREAQGPAMEATLVRNLLTASDLLAVEGMTGLIEPINSRLTDPRYFLDTPGQAARILEKVDKPNIKLQLDIFHCQVMDGNLTGNIRALFPLIGHIQVAQVPNRHEPSSQGEINYSYIFNLLQGLGYQGYVGCEYTPRESTVSGLGWLKEVRASH
ncbi:putative hydroxypyruvate isomerase isoform X3 [Lethenteron reissneri]|uniref:putative hydroxypyruvate isomerase isoform X3 n=1 Tax=Lethenteron reissneri TaxID=7753 RepID=UPI002AB6FB83|nr:putative hydroxypyruvate isomerase isoform X3 [Lethenteron reissneri]